tara:strand:+ start:25 stop:786 length:762 start_codon:yes stop_codon:yes gene_type:complete
MSALYKHKRYFRVRALDSSLKTFSSTADANTKIGFTSVWNTSSPTKTEVLADSNQTLVVTYEFETEADQAAFESAIDGAYADSSLPSTTTTTSILSLAYGFVGVYPGGAITINGTTVNFTTTTAGQATRGIAVGIGADIVADVNSAAIPHITASLSGSDVVLTHSQGNPINIVNTSTDGQGNNVAGPSSGTGWDLNTKPNTPDGLKLVYSKATATDTVEHFKTEWLHQDGSVSNTTDLNCRFVHHFVVYAQAR